MLESILSNIKRSKFNKCFNILIKYKVNYCWFNIFLSQYKRLYKILKTIQKDKLNNKIYPKSNQIFNIFKHNINDIEIVLLGQDPYYKYNQATGYAFSVPKDIQIPPSLMNIYKELKIEFPERNYIFEHGDISSWTNRGIFLLNTSLSVIESKPNSHQYLWKIFINRIIKYIDNYKSNIVFLLLGNNAINKIKYIKYNNIVTCVHPSPLSAHNGFFNSNIFKKIEDLLGKNINWKL